MAEESELTAYRIYRLKALAARLYVALVDSDTPLYAIKDPMFGHLELTNADADQVIWKAQSGGAFSFSKKFISAEYGVLVKFKQGKLFSRTTREFDYVGSQYKWRWASWLSDHYDCIRTDNGDDVVVASFKEKAWSRTYGYITLHNEAKWPPGLKEFMILSLYFVVEESRRQARQAGGD
ncbi:hypothetical protein H4R34_001335 [Dimargaris verticillata]|uniref:Uncharacterized protein n=1 Tax=Dimargaris verticillata TaxID=2761393 RepID=A0A9W8BA76_9FUNG|nr:hypothetical protein H4R34_001335 [Dimargaris verticillata]